MPTPPLTMYLGKTFHASVSFTGKYGMEPQWHCGKAGTWCGLGWGQTQCCWDYFVGVTFSLLGCLPQGSVSHGKNYTNWRYGEKGQKPLSEGQSTVRARIPRKQKSSGLCFPGECFVLHSQGAQLVVNPYIVCCPPRCWIAQVRFQHPEGLQPRKRELLRGVLAWVGHENGRKLPGGCEAHCGPDGR